jgi:RNA-directed DNA polymerase
LITRILQQLGLQLSAEKTKITSYGKGYAFLGFVLSSCSRRMREKSEKKFRDKVRALTVRHHNLDATVIMKLNRVIRGTAQYFATAWATVRARMRELDSWIRTRIRSMRARRKRATNNYRFPNRKIAKLGLLSLLDFVERVQRPCG